MSQTPSQSVGPNAHDIKTAPSTSVVALSLAAAIVPFLLLVWRFDFVCDDAYITFRYARNFADGAGLVYHVGIEQPVEGYSEFLWAVLLGLGFELGVAPETLSRVLSIGAGLAMVSVTSLLVARRFGRSPVASVGASALLGCAPPLAVWSTGGMATMPAASLALLLFAWMYRATDPRPIVRTGLVGGVLASLLALMRADAALLVALVLAPAILVGLVKRSKATWIPALMAALLSASAFGVHVMWRMSVYDDWLPNTARAKLGFSGRAAERGFDYVASMFLSMPGLGVAFVAAAVGAWLAARRAGAAAAMAASCVVIGITAYAIGTGGDFMAFGRFLVPAVPFAVLGFAAVLARLEERTRIGAGIVAAAAVVTTLLPAYGTHVVPESTRLAVHFRHNQRFSGVALSTSELQQWQNMRDRAEQWGVLGRALARHAPPEASVVYGAVGAIGYFSNLFVYDRNGLVTREVAMREPHEQLRSPGHDKVVPPGFFAPYRPTYIDVGVWPSSQFPPAAKAGRRLLVLGDTERPGWILWAESGP